MTRLWAVCNVDDSITFATALLDQPEEFQDLVIAHELVHLLFRDHGTHFRRILRLFVPDCERIARLAPESPAEWKRVKGVEEVHGAYRVVERPSRSQSVTLNRGSRLWGRLLFSN
jgi:predicted metal-dependent hydrolase